MDRPSRTEDWIRLRALRRWYAGTWVLFGLGPPVVAVHDRTDITKYGTYASIAVIALGFAIVTALPHNSAKRSEGFLCLLVAVLGVTANLLDGGAAFLIVSLPLFWIHTTSPRRAVGYTTAAAAAVVAGNISGSHFSSGNAVFTLLGYTGGVLLGLWMDRVVGQGAERARVLAAELERAQVELALAHQRQGASEERERIAREIHDTLAQGFASIVVLAQAARDGLGIDPVTSAKQLLSIENTARENLMEARVLVGAVPAGGAVHVAIAESLRRIVNRFAEDTGCVVHAELIDIACDQPTRIALLRCTQESLANARKHAGATTVSVILARAGCDIELEITDDGIGFAPSAARGFGLNGMRSRVAELGGELTVTSSPGEGTRIFVALPVNDRS